MTLDDLSFQKDRAFSRLCQAQAHRYPAGDIARADAQHQKALNAFFDLREANNRRTDQ